MNKLMSLIFAAFLGLFMVGCGENEDALEDTGDTMEQGVEETGDTLEEGVEESGEALEDAGDEMEEEYEETTN